MKEVTMFQADDGRQFHTREQCAEYEQQLQDTAAANEMFSNGATLLAALVRANQTRPWWDSGLGPDAYTILGKANKDTCIVIEHWQCSDKPGYKAIQIDVNGKVFVHGDVGCWSGPYGCRVELQDLLRYLRTTFKEAA